MFDNFLIVYWGQIKTLIAYVSDPASFSGMPVARRQIPPIAPAPLTAEEAKFISETIRQFLGDNAILRI